MSDVLGLYPDLGAEILSSCTLLEVAISVALLNSITPNEAIITINTIANITAIIELIDSSSLLLVFSLSTV